MKISRRNALGALAVPLFFDSPVLIRSGEASDSALLDLERRRIALIAAWHADPRSLTDDEFNAYGDRLDEIDEAIIATPAQGRDGLLVKWRHVQYNLDLGIGEGTDAAVDAFEADLLRLAGAA